MSMLRIIEQSSVTEAVGLAYAKYSRFHDLYEGLTWLLCHDPYPSQSHEVVPGIFACRVPTIKGDGFCDILLVYSVNEDVITIEDIRIDDIEDPS